MGAKSGRLRIAGAEGFTLIETMIAMFFIAFMVGEMAMVSVYASRSSNVSRRLTEANNLAVEIVEACRITAYPNLQNNLSVRLWNPAAGGTQAFTDACAVAGTTATCTGSALGYSWTRTVTPVPSTAAFLSSNSADVAVVVGWTDDRGGAHSVRLATVLSIY